MNAQRVFLAMGLIVAAFTGIMILARKTGARPEPLPFQTKAPAGTVVYVAVPEHAQLAESPLWAKLGLASVQERYRRAMPTLSKAVGPSAAVFVMRDGRWAAFFRLRASIDRDSGEVEGLHWAAADGIVSVAETAEFARGALQGPRASFGELTVDRDIVCGATRAPFVWFDLRHVNLPGRLADIGGVAFSAAADGDEIRVKALGVYYTAQRQRVYEEFLRRPHVELSPPRGAVAWHYSFESPVLVWKAALGMLTDADRKLIDQGVERLSTEFLVRGRIDKDVIPKIGPEWGVVAFDAETAFGFARVPDDIEPILKRAAVEVAKVRRERGLVPWADLENDALRLPWLKGGEPAYAIRDGLLLVATKKELLDDPSCLAFARPAKGEWQVGAGWDGAAFRKVAEEAAARNGWDLSALLAMLDARVVDVRARYSDAGLSGIIRIR